jgi:hypothetical protein
MAFPAFFDALFDLADMWSERVEAAAYAELLLGLLREAEDGGALEGALRRFPPAAGEMFGGKEMEEV